MKTLSLNDSPVSFVSFFIASAVLLFFMHFVLNLSIGMKGIFVLLFIGVSFFSVLNFYLSYSILLFLLFLPHFYAVHQVIAFSYILLLSFLVNFRGDFLKELKNPVLTALLLYILLMLPSLVTTPKKLLSIRDMSNIIALLLMFCITLISFKDYKKIISVFYFFIFAIFMHTLWVIYLGITTGERVFGILWVYYIDFAGLGALISIILFFYSKGISKVIFGISSVAITYGLILTQTRNAWLSFAVAFGSLLIFLIIKGEKFKIKRFATVITLLVMIGIIGGAMILRNEATSNIGDRLDEQSESVQIDEQDPTALNNSLITRILIWHTSYKAFLQKPVFGIGAYSFRFISELYYEIPKPFYEEFVKERTPHVTYLQVLTETGIVGLVAFLIFIIAIFKQIIQTLSRPNKTKQEIKLSLLICWSLIYIIFSMLMTESWLYGQYAVWTGILLGLLISNYKTLTSKTLVR